MGHRRAVQWEKILVNNVTKKKEASPSTTA